MKLKALTITLVLIFSTQASFGALENFYDQDKLRIFEIEFTETNWWQQLTANYDSKTNLLATLTFEDQVYEGVGVRFRGNTSYKKTNNSQKKSFNIEIDATDEDLRLMGYKTFNLINCMDDPTFMREVLYSNTVREQTPSARANFVKLIINGENWGIYANVQQINGDFIEEWFPSDDGARWHANSGGGGTGTTTTPTTPDTPTRPRTTTTEVTIMERRPGGPDGGGAGGGGGVSGGNAALTWQGDDPNTYQQYYELKNSKIDDPWTPLKETCDILNNVPLDDQLPEVLDTVLGVDKALWLCAFEIIFHDDDGYVHKQGADYGLYYEPETGRIHLLQYDGNSCMRMNNNQNWSLFYRADSEVVPIMNRLLELPSYRQRYLAHARTIVDTYLTEERLYPIIDDYRDLIETEVAADDKKLYSTAEFSSGINTLKAFISTRRDYIQNLNEINQAIPIIQAVHQETIQEDNSQRLLINATLDASVPVQRVQLYLAESQSGPFTPYLMTDNGQAADTQAGDLIYSITTDTYPPGTVLRYYIEAQANDTAGTLVYDPPGAEHHVYTHGITYPEASTATIVINELMPSNSTTLADPQGDYDDWIELLNVTDTAIDLNGMYLSDNPENPLKWEIPSTILQPGEFLIIWADEDSQDNEGLHANFKLSSKGETLWLYDTDANGNQLLDSLSFEQMNTDTSIGRVPDGGETIEVFNNPTPGTSNGVVLE